MASVEIPLKFVLVGNTSVGKSSILLRFTENSFSSPLCPTVGVDLKLKKISSATKRIKLSLWDTAGQERFRSLTPAYYRGADAILFVYDVSNAQSFRSLEDWISESDRFSTTF